MTVTELVPWIGLAISSAALLYTIFGNRAKANAQKIAAIDNSVSVLHNDITVIKAALELRVDRVEDRLTRAESDISHMPGKEVTHRLEVTVTELRGDVKSLTESIKPIRAMADRMQEALLDRVTNT